MTTFKLGVFLAALGVANAATSAQWQRDVIYQVDSTFALTVDGALTKLDT